MYSLERRSPSTIPGTPRPPPPKLSCHRCHGICLACPLSLAQVQNLSPRWHLPDCLWRHVSAISLSVYIVDAWRNGSVSDFDGQYTPESGGYRFDPCGVHILFALAHLGSKCVLAYVTTHSLPSTTMSSDSGNEYEPSQDSSSEFEDTTMVRAYRINPVNSLMRIFEGRCRRGI